MSRPDRYPPGIDQALEILTAVADALGPDRAGIRFSPATVDGIPDPDTFYTLGHAGLTGYPSLAELTWREGANAG